MDFLQHHQDPPRHKTKFYRHIKNVVQNEILKSETQFNCPITINVHVHQTKFPVHRRFTYCRSRPKEVLQASNITDKDVTTNAAPCRSFPELLSDINVFNARTDSMSPQINSAL